MANRPSRADDELTLTGASLSRATMAEMTASNGGSIPFTVDVVGQRSLRYSEGNSNYLSENNDWVRNYTNGFLTRDGAGTETFTAANMSSIGTMLSAEDYGYASKRLYNLSANYDEAGWWHDVKTTVSGWFGAAPTPVRTPDMEQERWELRQITASYTGAHPEIWNSVIAGVDAAAGGPVGAAAVLAARNSREDQQYAYRFASSIDQGVQAYGSLRIAAQNNQTLQSYAKQRASGLEPISIRDGQAGLVPANPAISYAQQKVSPSSVTFSINTQMPKERGWPGTGGAGPVNGTIGFTNETSTASLRNYYPKGGGVEFVYDPASDIFVAGRPEKGLFNGSPHQQLAQSINASNERVVVGGTFTRGPNGEFFTTEHSGHYGQNWTDPVRSQFEAWLQSRTGVPVTHQPWGKK